MSAVKEFGSFRNSGCGRDEPAEAMGFNSGPVLPVRAIVDGLLSLFKFKRARLSGRCVLESSAEGFRLSSSPAQGGLHQFG